MTKVALYTRVSTMEQAEQGTIENQLQFLTKYCALHSLEVAGVYSDEGVSGTTEFASRPDGGRLLRDAQAGLFDTLIVYKVDRLARSVLEFYRAYELFDHRKIAFRSATEPIDTGTSIGRMMMGMLAVFAEMERDTIFERTMGGRLRIAGAGYWPGGSAPFGYCLRQVTDDHGHEVTDIDVSDEILPCGHSEAGIMRLIYDCIVYRDLSTQQTCDYLEGLGIPCPFYCRPFRNPKKMPSVHWRSSTIVNLVKNTTYKGFHQYAHLQRPCPPIVSEEIWQAAQDKFKARHRAGRGGDNAYLLRGLIKCGGCGYAYCGSQYKHRKKTNSDWYYICNGNRCWKQLKGSETAPCKAPIVNGPKLEAAIWQQLLHMARHQEETLAEIAASFAAVRVSATERLAERDQAEHAVTMLDLKRVRLNEGFLAGALSVEEVKGLKEQLDREEQALVDERDRLRTLVAEAQHQEQALQRATTALDLLAAVGAGEPTFAEKQAAIRLAVEEVVIHRNKIRQPRITVKLALRATPDVADLDSGRELCVQTHASLPLPLWRLERSLVLA